MAYRTASFDEYLAKELQDPEMAKEFLLSGLEGEDGFTLVESLKRTIRAMGTTEYSQWSGINRAVVARMLSQEDIPKIETLNKYLAPFGLEALITVKPKEVA